MEQKTQQTDREVIFEPKEFDPIDFGLPAEVREFPELIPVSAIPSQCGLTNEAQHVESYDGTLGVSVAFVNQHQRPVGQTMQGNTRLCSGTLIDADLFLTAGHCVDSQAPPTQVTFNFQLDPFGNPRLEQRFPVLAVLEDSLGGLDYAIIQLDGNPGTVFGQALISRADAAVGDIVAIIGHPAGAPKQIEAGPVHSLTGNRIRYNRIDTLPGNSGSGILHGESGLLVGVHTNGGCDGSNPETGFNVGVRISSLLRESPILKRLAADSDLIFTPLRPTINDVKVGVTGRKTLRIRNPLDFDVSITIPPPDPSKPFRWLPISATIPSGQDLAIEIKFTPPNTLPVLTFLTVVSNAPGSPHKIGVLGKSLGGF